MLSLRDLGLGETDYCIKSGYSLVCFDKLVESQQAAVPGAAVLRLQVHAELVYNGGPASWEVVLNDGSQTHGQLGSLGV